MLVDVVAKLPLPVMLAAVGAWPISSASAGVATAATPPPMSVRTTASLSRIVRNAALLSKHFRNFDGCQCVQVVAGAVSAKSPVFGFEHPFRNRVRAARARR